MSHAGTAARWPRSWIAAGLVGEMESALDTRLDVPGSAGPWAPDDGPQETAILVVVVWAMVAKPGL